VPVVPKEILVSTLVLSKCCVFLRASDENFVIHFSLCATCNTNLTVLRVTGIICVTARLTGLGMMQTNAAFKCTDSFGHNIDTPVSLLLRYRVSQQERKI
jgi:hypothetical protein